MENTPRLIDLHEQWKRSGKLPENGLCGSVPEKYKKTLREFQPKINLWTRKELSKPLDLRLSAMYWASGLTVGNPGRERSYTRLRQAIVILICLIHDEI